MKRVVVQQRSAAPSTLDRRMAECVQRIYSGAASGRGYGEVWSDIAALFSACRVELRCNLDLSFDAVSSTAPLLLFDRGVRVELLRQALRESGADQGVCAFIREGRRGLDVLVVLRRSTPFTREECEWLELLARHLGAAFELGQRMVSPTLTFASAAQFARLLPQACILTEPTGHCLEENQAFSRSINRIGGSLRAGRLVFDDLVLQQTWERTLEEAQATEASRSFTASAADGVRWNVHVVPFTCVDSTLDPTRRRVVLAIFESTSATDHRPVVTPSLSLTRAEHEVLSMLLLGRSAKAIAHARQASVNTVRSQITSILGKTGHHTQKQLMASFSSNLSVPPSDITGSTVSRQ